jgi:hypothetical protein
VEQIGVRAQQGEDVEAIFAEMNLPVIPRVQEMIVVAPDLEWIWDETFYCAALSLSPRSDGKRTMATDLEVSAEDLGNGTGPWRVSFGPRPEGDALVMAWVDVSQNPQRIWMARLEGEAVSPNGTFRVTAIEPSGSLITWPFFDAERGAREQARVESGEITLDQMLDEMNIPIISRQAHLQIHNLTGDIRQIQILETFLDQPELHQTVSVDFQPIPGESNAWTGTFTRQLQGDFLSIPTVNAAGESGTFAVRLRPLAAAMLTSDARALECQANLRRIHDAIIASFQDSGRPAPSPLTMEDLVGGPSLPELPVCPAGGVYGSSAGPGVFPLTEPPTCSLGGDHVFVPLPTVPSRAGHAPEGTEEAVRARLGRAAP